MDERQLLFDTIAAGGTLKGYCLVKETPALDEVLSILCTNPEWRKTYLDAIETRLLSEVPDILNGEFDAEAVGIRSKMLMNMCREFGKNRNLTVDVGDKLSDLLSEVESAASEGVYMVPEGAKNHNTGGEG